MEIKKLVTRINYRIEPKEGGGFIARSVDPSVPSIEASSREELQKKLQAEILSELGTGIAGLTLPFMMQRVATALQNRITAQGTAVIDSRDGEAVSKGASPDQLNQLAQRLAGFVGKNFPEASNRLSPPVPSTQSTPAFEDSTNGFTASADNQPIVPEASGSWTFFRFLLIVLVLGAIGYLFVLRHH